MFRSDCRVLTLKMSGVHGMVVPLQRPPPRPEEDFVPSAALVGEPTLRPMIFPPESLTVTQSVPSVSPACAQVTGLIWVNLTALPGRPMNLAAMLLGAFEATSESN